MPTFPLQILKSGAIKPTFRRVATARRKLYHYVPQTRTPDAPENFPRNGLFAEEESIVKPEEIKWRDESEIGKSGGALQGKLDLLVNLDFRMAKSDWDIFRTLAKAVSKVATEANLPVYKDVFAVPIQHDTEGETTQPEGKILDWSKDWAPHFKTLRHHTFGY